MRILLLSQWYPPEPAHTPEEFVHTLRELGHDVEVLTGFPNYPSGKLHSDYKLRLWQRDVLEGISVTRVYLYPDHSRSGIKRALNYFSFALSSSILGRWLVSLPDVMFVYHPPLTVGIPGYILSRMWRIPFVYQIQDMWPETLSATGMLRNPRILDIIRIFANWVYRRADAICVISPGFRQNLISKGVPPEKIHVVSNWVDTAIYHPVPPDRALGERLGLNDKFNIMFAGNIGAAQALDAVLDAAKLLEDRSDIQFVLVGDGVALPSLRQKATELGLENVRFLGRYPASDMLNLYALADVLLVHLKDDPLFQITIPHKIYAYLASAKPILAAVNGDAADVIEEVRAGITCPPEDASALASAALKLHSLNEKDLQAMGSRGLLAARTRYSRKKQVSELADVLRLAVDHNG